MASSRRALSPSITARRIDTFLVVLVAMIFYRLMHAMFGIVEKLKQSIGVIAKRQGDGGECLDIKAENGALIANTQLVACAEDDIPYLEPFFGERCMRNVRAAFAG